MPRSPIPTPPYPGQALALQCSPETWLAGTRLQSRPPTTHRTTTTHARTHTPPLPPPPFAPPPTTHTLLSLIRLLACHDPTIRSHPATVLVRYELDAGMAFVNDFCKSNSRYPFGGHKDSGVGRECGEYGLKEFCNIKTVFCPV